MQGLPGHNGSIRLRNNTPAPYVVEEMGGTTIAPGAELDMMAEETPGHYGDYSAAHHLVTDLSTSKLRQDIVSGAITVTLDQLPRM